MTQDSVSARRIELILKQVESLPTLPSVATRLLQVTSSQDSNASEVVSLIQSDAALTGKILALCKPRGGGVRKDVMTIDRAVVMLGFEAIRNAVLSIKVFEIFNDTGNPVDPRFEQSGFWRHSLALAIASELIAEKHKGLDPVLKPDEAFVCGLMSGMGKVALFHILPKAYQRVMELTDAAHTDVAEVEQKVIGLDHHMAGKRLAEYWKLPRALGDTMWLYNTKYDLVPTGLDHRILIGVVGVADILVRRQHIGYSGNYVFRETVEQRAKQIGLDPFKVEQVGLELHEELHHRSEAMGFEDTPSKQLFVESILQANQMLARLNTELEMRRSAGSGQPEVLEYVIRFHQMAQEVNDNIEDTLQVVVKSAVESLGEGYYATLYQARARAAWELIEYTPDGEPVRSQVLDAPKGMINLSLFRSENASASLQATIVNWLSAHLSPRADMNSIRLLSMPADWGCAGILIHEWENLPDSTQLRALTVTWGAAVAAATRIAGASRLGEELTDVNRRLSAAQEKLTRDRSLARLGEMAAGAAHEMNNPLMVITGRSQILASRLKKGTREREMSEQIVEQSEKLSDLITSLHLFADAPKPKMRAVVATDMVSNAVREVKTSTESLHSFKVVIEENMPLFRSDPEMLVSILSELMINALQAEPKNSVSVGISVDSLNNRINMDVRDDGVGMDPRTLEHAFDPFFSNKEAGRQTGLGLSRAKRLTEALEGDLELISRPGEGTTARLSLPLRLPETQTHL